MLKNKVFVRQKFKFNKLLSLFVFFYEICRLKNTESKTVILR